MLYFTRWKAAAIVLTALIVCLFAVPNFFPDKMVQSWPKWAQRHMVLGLDLQGGSHILLEVDTKAVRKDMLETLRDDVRRVLRDARVGYTGLAVRGNTVEVRIRDTASFDNALTKLRELSLPLGGVLGGSGQRSLNVSDAGDGLVRLDRRTPSRDPQPQGRATINPRQPEFRSRLGLPAAGRPKAPCPPGQRDSRTWRDSCAACCASSGRRWTRAAVATPPEAVDQTLPP